MTLMENAVGRRQFVTGAAALSALTALAGCGKKGDPSNGAVDGGTFRYYIGNPVSIDPYNCNESEGSQVCNQLFDALTTYNYETKEIEPLACTSWESNEDATEFTFHLIEGAKFHDGTPVTAADFKRGWERLVNPNINPEQPSEIGYHLAMVEGYKDDGTTTELTGVTCPDDLTLKVKLRYSYGDFPFVVTHIALAPVPACAEDDFMTYFLSPVGNGPFKMDGKWEDGQYISVVRNDDYYGEPAKLAGINFMILKDVETAYREFEAGNLDYTDIPQAQILAANEAYGVSDDGYNISEGKHVLHGAQPSVYYLVCNNVEGPFADPELRKAVSLCINREAICDTLFHGTRIPADNFVTPGVLGYEEGVWEYSKYDPEQAKKILDDAGYTADANGSRGLNLTLSYNNGAGHGELMTSVIGDLNAIGINAVADTPEWAALIEQYGSGAFEFGRMGWTADYPIIDNFLFPMFHTGNGDNRSGYSRPDLDAKMFEARSTADEAQRVALWKEINREIAADCPVIPILFHCHNAVVGNNVKKFTLTPTKRAQLQEAELS